jgi:hypothetical protein
MDWINKWLSRFTNRFSTEKIFSVIRTEEAPDSLEECVVYLLGEGDYLWSAVLLCPCGCKEAIHLNLLPDASPCWSVRLSGKKLWIDPSIARQNGCRSHFFVRAGKIEWFCKYDICN